MADKVQKWKNRKKISWAGWLFIFLFSLIAGFSVSAVVVTGGDAWDFYDSGDVWEVSIHKYIYYPYSKIQYLSDQERTVILDDQAFVTANSYMKNCGWKYVKVFISDLSSDTLDMKLNYLKRDQTPVGSETFSLKEGENKFALTCDAFSGITVEFQNQKDVSFSDGRIQLMTQDIEIDNKRIFLLGIVFAVMCVIMLSVCFHIALRKNFSVDFYAPLLGLQRLYIKFGGFVPKWMLKISPKYRRWMRIFLIMLIFLSLTGFNVFNLFMNQNKYVMLVLCVMLLCLAFLSVDGELKPVQWRNPLVMSWFVFWMITCVSDFIIKKNIPAFSFYGYIMLFLMGFLFFVWNQKEDRRVVWKEICRAAEGTFFVAMAFCLFCRPEIANYRYNGAYTNPNPFGLYLAVTGCIFLCELDQYIHKDKKDKAGKINLVIFCSCMAALLFFLNKTQCVTGILALGVSFLLWFFGYIRRGVGKKLKKRFIVTVLLLAILIVPVFSGLQWGIRTLPYVFHTSVSYPEDTNYVKNDKFSVLGGDVVYAADIDLKQKILDISSNRVFQKFIYMKSLNDFLSGRITNYTSYLKDMNLPGHMERPMIYGAVSRHAHNGVLAYAHNYGVFAAIPYIFFYLYFLYYGFIYWRQNRKTDGFCYLPLSIGIVFFLENAADNVDISFHWIVWFLFFFFVGSFFNFEDKGNHRAVCEKDDKTVDYTF